VAGRDKGLRKPGAARESEATERRSGRGDNEGGTARQARRKMQAATGMTPPSPGRSSPETAEARGGEAKDRGRTATPRAMRRSR
jgi:hypothetical protein